MSQYFYIPEEKVGIAISTIEEELACLPKKVKKHTKKRLCASGGIFVSTITADMLCQMKELVTTSDVAASLDNVVPGPNITILTDFTEGLTKKEVRAAIMHEVGHVRDGMLDRLHLYTESSLADCFVIDLTAELVADAYAAETVGKEAMRSALVKLIHNTVKVIFRFASPKAKLPEFDDLVNQLLADPVIVARLAALS